MDKKIFVERETFNYNGKEYFSYCIKGKIRGKDVKVAITPPDKGGFTVLDIVYADAMEAELTLKPYEIKDEKTGKVTSGNTYAVQSFDEDGLLYECPVKPMRASDRSLLNMLLR
jgi:hypothetical protein